MIRVEEIMPGIKKMYKTVLHPKMKEFPGESVTVFAVLHYVQ